MNQSGKMLKWSIELCGYDIKFKPRTSIKAQALVDFLVETSFTEEVSLTSGLQESSPQQFPDHWTMFIDGSVNVRGVGVRIVMKSPSEEQVDYKSIRLDYPASNNQPEYEALIQGL